MSHDPTKVLLGGRVSSIADITCEDGDPRVFVAGLAVRKNSSGELLLADNGVSPLMGVSAGQALVGDTKTSVFKTGNFIPLLLQDEAASVVIGDLTFTAAQAGDDGDSITITLADLASDGEATVVVDGNDIVISIDATVTTAQTIKDAIEEDEEASALVLVEIADGDEASAQAAAGETSLSGGLTFNPILGSAVKIDDTTGKASDGGDTTAASFVSGRLTGVYPTTKIEAPCALISLFGGF